jgi:hypothetical protein
MSVSDIYDLMARLALWNVLGESLLTGSSVKALHLRIEWYWLLATIFKYYAATTRICVKIFVCS